MIAFFREGGFPMFFLLGFGVLTLWFGARYAWLPNRVRFRLTMGFGFATLFTTLTSVATDLAVMGHQVPDYLARHHEEPLAHVVLQGIAESLAPAILGFTLLSLTALLTTLGLYREPLP